MLQANVNTFTTVPPVYLTFILTPGSVLHNNILDFNSKIGKIIYEKLFLPFRIILNGSINQVKILHDDIH